MCAFIWNIKKSMCVPLISVPEVVEQVLAFTATDWNPHPEEVLYLGAKHFTHICSSGTSAAQSLL